MYYVTNKIRPFVFACAMLVSSVVLASDFISITTPADSSTVSGTPLIVEGTSSQPNSQVQFIFNGVDVGDISTDSSGNFFVSFASVANGLYTITLNLLASDNTTVLATTTVNFAVVNPASISIDSPVDGTEVFFNPFTVSGSSNEASVTVNVSVDGVLAATTTTDSDGNWSVSFSLASNGTHTILAELVVGGTTVASSSISILATVIQKIIKGLVPTIGSGSGPGFTYSVSGSTITVTATTPFTFTPVALATGQSSTVDSTVTILSSTNSVLNMTFSLGTENVYFLWAAFS